VLRNSWHAISNCTSSRNCWKVVPAAARRRFSVRVERRRVDAASSIEGRPVPEIDPKRYYSVMMVDNNTITYLQRRSRA